METTNTKEKMRLTAHISEELYRRLERHHEKAFKKRHGTLSLIVERALDEYLEKVEKA
jgi:hypothetical protein